MLNGETNSELMIDNISGDDQGGYTVVVSNRGGNVESKVASLVVLLPVDIVEDVKDLTVREGAIARFEVEVTGTSPFNYQWFYGGIPIEDAIDPIYEIGIVSNDDRGLYSVEVQNELGRIRSREAKLNVSVTPKIISDIEDQRVLVGSVLTLQASASGTEPLIYNWYRQGKLYHSGGADLSLIHI